MGGCSDFCGISPQKSLLVTFAGFHNKMIFLTAKIAYSVRRGLVFQCFKCIRILPKRPRYSFYPTFYAKGRNTSNNENYHLIFAANVTTSDFCCKFFLL